MRRPNWFRQYGAILIFLVMALTTAALHYTFAHDAAVNEAKDHCPTETGCFEEDEFRAEYFRDFFENHQSEYAQLFFQSLLMVAWARWFMWKQQEDFEEIKELLRDLGAELPDDD